MFDPPNETRPAPPDGRSRKVLADPTKRRTSPTGASRSLAWHLGAGALAIALPLIVVTMILVGWVTHSDREAKRTLLVGDAHALADAVSSQIDKYLLLANALSRSDLLLRGDFAGFKQQASEIAAGLKGASIIVYSPEGRPLLSVPELPADSPLWKVQHDFVGRALASRQASVADVVPAQPGVDAHASIETPVLRDGQPIYEVELVLWTNQFIDLLARQNYGDNLLTGIIDSAGNFVARFPAGSTTPGSRASDDFRAAAHNLPGSLTTHYSVDGQQIVSAYVPIADGWTVGIADSALQFQVGPSVLMITGALALTGLAASLFLSFLNGRKLTRQLKDLQSKAEQLVAGTPVVRGVSGVLELDAVSAALEEASVVLRRRADRQKRAEDELRKSEEHFRLLADSVPQLVWTARPDGRIDYTNGRREDYGTGGVSRTDWETIIHPDDRRATAEAWLKSSETGTPYEKEHRLLVNAKGYAWHLSRAVPLLDENGEIVRWYGATTDINDHKLREERIRSLIAEVNHRSRNLLAVAQSIARQSVKDGESAQEYAQKYSRRLLALVACLDLLTENQWNGVALDALVASQTRQGPAQVTKRVSRNGPPILLNPATAQALGLAVNELFSNAMKYGALSNDDGVVTVNWSIDETGPEARFAMEWRESGGPPVPPDPTPGFGAVLMVRMLTLGLNGKANLSFEPTGVVWSLDARLKEIVNADVSGD